MPSTLTGFGTISYNGFTFAGPTVSSRITMTPVADRTGRGVLGWKHVLHIECYMTGDDVNQSVSTDPANYPDPVGDPDDNATAPGTLNYAVSRAKQLLGQTGGELIYIHKGFGPNFKINTPGSTRQKDINWGPKPIKMEWRPIGVGMAWHLIYEIEFTIPRCQTPVAVDGDIIEQSYSVDFAISEAGLTVRTVAGMFRISASKQSADSPGPIYTADAFREQIANLFPVPVGWTRRSQNFRIEPDRTTVNWTIIDGELESNNSYPPGVSHIAFRQRVSAQRPTFLTLQVGMFISITVNKDYSLADAFERAILMIRERITTISNFATLVLLESFEFEESVYDRKVIINSSYRVGVSDLSTLQRDTALFQAVNVNTETDWRNSMSAKVWSARGLYGAADETQSDIIANPCLTLIANPLIHTPQQRMEISKQKRLSGNCVPYYIYFRPSTQYDTEEEEIIHRTVEEDTNPFDPTIWNSERPFGSPKGTGLKPPRNSKNNPETQDQYPAHPSRGNVYTKQKLTLNGVRRITFSGTAMRVASFPSLPELTQWYNAKTNDKLSIDKERVVTTRVGDISGCPVYRTDWRITFIVHDDTSTVGANENTTNHGTEVTSNPNDDP